jgi:hypothetical protein
MLATLAALQLLLFSQAPPLSKEVTPDEQIAEEQALPPREAGSAPELNPPLPNKRGAPAPSPAPTPAPTTVTAAPQSPSRQLSLLSSEPLGGASASLAWVGYSSLGIMYGQGITRYDDLGALLDFDWVDTELRLGGFYRRPLGEAGGFDMAGRLTATWYKDFGATWIHGRNFSDHGVEVAPGLSFSMHAAGGILSAIAEAPLTITLKYGAGLLFRPRFSLAYEGPLYREVTLGARLGLGYRAGSGDAPLPEGRGEVFFLLLAGYRLL